MDWTMSELEYEPHDGRHQNCAPCYRVKLDSIQFTSVDAGQRRFTEKERDRDMDAYQKLRRQGYQPKNVFGSAEIAAQASTPFELEHSVVMKPSIRKEMESKMAQTAEMFSA